MKKGYFHSYWSSHSFGNPWFWQYFPPALGESFHWGMLVYLPCEQRPFDLPKLTWDQALFSFRFENYIPAGKAKRKISISAVAVRENVWEPLKLGLISGYPKSTYLGRSKGVCSQGIVYQAVYFFVKKLWTTCLRHCQKDYSILFLKVQRETC